LISRESHLDVETEEPEAPKDAEDSVPDSPCSDVQREEHSDHVPDVVDPVLSLERLVFAPPVKRRPTWLRETLQEAEKHTAPPGTFRESRRP
jgi:hypothetical protein